MAITVEWDNPEKTIVLFTNAGNQTWEEFFAAARQANEMIRSVSHDVALIIDGRSLKTIPPSALTHFRNAVKALPPNTKVVVTVSDSHFLQAIASVVQRITHTNALMVSTLEEGRTRVQSMMIKA